MHNLTQQFWAWCIKFLTFALLLSTWFYFYPHTLKLSSIQYWSMWSCLALSATDSQFCHVCGGWGGWIIIIKVPSMVGNTTDTNSHDPLKLYCDPQGFQHPSVHSKTYPINLWVALALVTNRLFAMMMMMSWCLMSSDVSWHIRDKLWPMPKHGSIILYVHGNQKAH